jgi:hypothetical protein
LLGGAFAGEDVAAVGVHSAEGVLPVELAGVGAPVVALPLDRVLEVDAWSWRQGVCVRAAGSVIAVVFLFGWCCV